MKSFFSTILLIFSFSNLWAQEGHTSWWEENNGIKGYVKYMNSSSFENLNFILNDNLIHQRLQWDAYWNNQFSSTLSFRNRILWGNTVNITPNYASILDNNSQAIDLDWIFIDEPAILMHTQIDRLYVSYISDKWSVNVGRQRINWGKNLAWNPNDLFNAYSFFDFDYEERPGVDAVKIEHFLSGDSSLETAINYTDNWDKTTMALKYNFHWVNYDVQVLLAKYHQDMAIGLGWEGAIKNMGIKGEVSYFTPYETDSEEKDVLVWAISLDYYFKNGWSTTLGNLYTSNGLEKDALNLSLLTSFEQSAKRLMPNRNSFFLQFGKPLTPAINFSLSTIYAKEMEGFYFMPQFSYSLAQNWDLDLLGQLFYTSQRFGSDTATLNKSQTVYIRFRWSY